MAIFYLVRHGEADYSDLLEKGFFGFGRDFAPLSKIGIEQVEKAATVYKVMKKNLFFKHQGTCTRL